MGMWTDSVQCVEKDPGGILDFWPERLQYGESIIWGGTREEGKGRVRFGVCLACDTFWTFI